MILHEEAEDGNAMPDLTRPVDAVSKAVANLVKVGRETINSSDDQILRQEMPGSLQRVNGASKLLEEACAMLKADPYSQPARKKLIEGARGKRIQDTHIPTLATGQRTNSSKTHSLKCFLPVAQVFSLSLNLIYFAPALLL